VIRTTFAVITALVVVVAAIGCQKSSGRRPAGAEPAAPTPSGAPEKKRSTLPSDLPTEILAQVKQAQAYQKIAAAIDEKIAASVSIDELRVAYSGKTASLSGYAKIEASRARAQKIASEFDKVEKVLNGIVVRP
jgi:osmotically-inducible protein OsmY